jgi:adenylate kinase family enzyme
VLEMIMSFLRFTGIKPDTFGRLTVNDPWLVEKLKEGRVLSDDAEHTILTFMHRYEDTKE